MKVVSNTSPLTNLAAIGQFGLLRQLYGRLAIAEGVWGELNAFGHAWSGRDETAAASWIERFDVRNTPLVKTLRRDLDRGEAETIVLALEVQADLVLMDEREGRHAAQRFGTEDGGGRRRLVRRQAAGAPKRGSAYIRCAPCRWVLPGRAGLPQRARACW